MKTVLKYILLVILTILLALGSFAVTQAKGWPWWMALVIFFSVVGVVMGIRAIQRIIHRRREKGFIKQVMEEGGTILTPKREYVASMDSKWNHGIEVLKNSRLRTTGKPLYALPWYMVIGESGAGKTSSIAGAAVNMPVIDEKLGNPECKPTDNFDWWLFENSVVIDTAGRYIEEEGGIREQEEWSHLLAIISKYRKREPLNGLVLAVPADKLLSMQSPALYDLGKLYRRRIDQIMRIIGAKFPIYILITKFDRVAGASAFARQIDEEKRNEPVGFINDTPGIESGKFVDQSISYINNRLRDLLLIFPDSGVEADDDLLLLREEFDRLKTGLTNLITGAFADNPYQETPYLRGLFFSSAVQDGVVDYKRLGEFGIDIPDTKPSLKPDRSPLFLHGIYNNVLPRDRNMYLPLDEAQRWLGITRNAGILAWYMVVIAICGLVIFTGARTRSVYNSLIDSFKNVERAKDFGTEYLVNLQRYAQALHNYHQLQNRWFMKFTPFDRMAESDLAKLDLLMTQSFRKNVLGVIDSKLNELINTPGKKIPPEVLPYVLDHLVRRIVLIDARTAGKTDLSAYESVSPIGVAMMGLMLSPDTAEAFSYLYTSYVENAHDLLAIKDERESLFQMLSKSGITDNPDMDWILKLASESDQTKAVTIDDFWTGSGKVLDAPEIGAEYTRNGKAFIDDYLEHLGQLYPHNSDFTQKIKLFRTHYHEERAYQWTQFGLKFDRGKEKLPTRQEWIDAINSLLTPSNPYYAFLDKLREDWTDDENKPEWAQMADQFYAVKTLGISDESKIIKQVSLFSKIFMRDTADVVQETAQPKVSAQLNSADEFATYQNGIADSIKDIQVGAGHAYQDAVKFYSYPVDAKITEKDAPLNASLVALNTLIKLMAGNNEPAQGVFWNILRGPLEMTLDFMNTEASCYLQKEWDSKVVAGTEGLSVAQLMKYLFDTNGKVWNFTSGAASAFLTMDSRNFYPVALDERTVGFTVDFMKFINEGNTFRSIYSELDSSIITGGKPKPKTTADVQAGTGSQIEQLQSVQFDITIDTLPTDVNTGAVMKPFSTLLQVSCESGSKSLENFNYPATLAFKWSMEDCANAVLSIKFQDFTLKKTYAGLEGFVTFLNDFRGGSKSFTPDDFPEYKDALALAKAEFITVRYAFQGRDEILDNMTYLATLQDEREKLLKQFQTTIVPTMIAACWGIDKNTIALASTGLEGVGNISTSAPQPAAAGQAPAATAPANSPASAPVNAPEAQPAQPEPPSTPADKPADPQPASPPADKPADPPAAPKDGADAAPSGKSILESETSGETANVTPPNSVDLENGAPVKHHPVLARIRQDFIKWVPRPVKSLTSSADAVNATQQPPAAESQDSKQGL